VESGADASANRRGAELWCRTKEPYSGTPTICLLTAFADGANIFLSMWRKEDVIQKLKDSQADRSLRSYADTLGCSPSYLCDLYSGKREPGEKILKQLGLEKKVTKTVTYVKRRWR